MRLQMIAMAGLATVLTMTGWAQTGNPQEQGDGQRAGRGWGSGMAMGRGIAGTVTEVASDHFTIRNEQGESWTVHYSANTRVMKQPARRQGAPQDGERQMPEAIKPTDFKVGDVIAAGGEVDATAKSVGAMFVLQVDPERAKQMREMQANFGKTWLIGRVTAIHETTLTLHSGVDNAAHTCTADENTMFRKRRDPITLADVQVGDNLRVEGAMKDGKFMATTVSVMMPPMRGGPIPRPGDAPK